MDILSDEESNSTFNQSDSAIESSTPSGGEWVSACYFIVSISGFLGNALVVFVLARVRKLRTVPNMFILHQSIVDLISSLLVLALTITDVSLPDGYIIPRIMCKLWLSRYLLWSCYMVSTMNLVSLTLERCHSILRPLQHNMLVSKDRVLALFPILWFLGFAFITYVIFMYNLDDTGTMCNLGRLDFNLTVGLGIVTVLLYYIIPIGVMMFAYLSMWFEIRKNKQPPVAIPSNSSGEAAAISKKDKERQKIERNILKVLFLVVLVYFVCWGPNQIGYLQFCLGGHLDFNSTFFHISVIMITCNVSINPIIYALKYQQFRQGLRSVVCRSNRVEDSIGLEPSVSSKAT